MLHRLSETGVVIFYVWRWAKVQPSCAPKNGGRSLFGSTSQQSSINRLWRCMITTPRYFTTPSAQATVFSLYYATVTEHICLRLSIFLVNGFFLKRAASGAV